MSSHAQMIKHFRIIRNDTALHKDTFTLSSTLTTPAPCINPYMKLTNHFK